jgi:hypothetical protein
MSKLFTSHTDKNLSIKFNTKNGKGTITGTSIDLDSTNKLANLTSILKEYAKEPAKETTIAVKLEYFNTRSASNIWKVFKTLEELNLSKKSKASVTWCTEPGDKDLIETAKVYQSLCPSLPIYN